MKGFAIVAIIFFISLLVYDPQGRVEGLGKKEKEEKKGNENAASPGAPRHANVKYTIVVNAGNYMPGSMVYGRLGPLRGYREVADEFEQLFPDTRIELRIFPTDRSWVITQQLGDMAPDIMEMNTGDVWQDVDKGWYLRLNDYLEQPNPFVEPGAPGSKQWWDLFKYQHFCRGLVFTDGGYYVICFDMICAAFYYNKDIFRELDLTMPQNWQEFLKLQKKIKDAGYVPLGLGISWAVTDWVLDFVFDQLYYDISPGIDVYDDPTRGKFLDWNEIVFLYRKGFFTSKDTRWVEMWRLMKQWRQYWNKSLTVSPAELFMNKKAAMIWDISSLSLLLNIEKSIDFEWGVTYMPPMTKATSIYCVGADPCVVSGARTQICVTKTAFSDTKNPETSERLKRVIAFLQFITVPKNYRRIVNEAQLFLPDIVGVDPPEHMRPFEEIAGRRINPSKWQFTFDHRFGDTIQRMTNLYIENGISDEEFLRWIDTAMDKAVEDAIVSRKYNAAKLEAKWEELAPLRKGKRDLPCMEGK